MNGDDSTFKDLLESDDSISMLEKTSVRLMPIINEVISRMVKEKEIPGINHFDSMASIGPQPVTGVKKALTKIMEETDNSMRPPELDMRTLLGYLNQNEWLFLLNIGNIMQVSPLTVQDLYSYTSVETELTRDSILEKVSFLAVSYFCISTELRFIV